jgi:uncharacterized protein YndB with AHSA1/START domain
LRNLDAFDDDIPMSPLTSKTQQQLRIKMYILWGVGLLAGGIAIALIVLAFLPKTFTVQREVTIDRPANEVFDYLKDLRNQSEFSMWSQLDPRMDKTFRGTGGTVGSVYAWSSNERNVGIGELEVKALEENRRIELEIRFTKPFVSTDPTVIELESIDTGRTRIMQTYYGKMPYPMNALCPVISKSIGDGMDSTFKNLRRVLDNKTP